MLVLLKGEIYEIRRFDGVRCHDMHTKFHKDWFRQSKVNKGETDKHTYTRARARTHTHTHTHTGDLASLLLFFQNKERRPKKWI
jgi:hypothetical protein